MMPGLQTTSHLLAAGDTNPIVPILFIGIFIFIWGAGAIAAIKSAAKKNQIARGPQPPRLPPTRAGARMPPPLPGIPQQFQTRQVQRSPLSPSGAPLPPLRTKPRGNLRKPPPLPLPAAKRGSQAPQPSSILASPTSPTRPPVPTSTSTRSKIAAWLTPQTLRSQIILTEALRPPAALRKDRF